MLVDGIETKEKSNMARNVTFSVETNAKYILLCHYVF